MIIKTFLLRTVIYLLSTSAIVWGKEENQVVGLTGHLQVRSLQDSTKATPYYILNDSKVLGAPNLTAALGNPLKGLAGGPRWSQSLPLPSNVPSAIEFYNIGLDEIMIGNNAFNWTLHDKFLSESASRKMHAVLSVYIHWPGQPLRLPPHLLDIPLYDTADNGKSPNYGDSRLLTALQQFIVAWGKHTDGDTRVAAIHVGLLGFWGEGHTYPDTTLVPESSKQLVAQWYRNSFNKTQIQARYPGPNANGFGLYDGSLAYTTLDGDANGGETVSWHMYPQMLAANQHEIWKQYIMGGETRPELQKIIFTNDYPARTVNHQDYKECIDTLHITYALHHDAFENGGYSGSVLQKANAIHAYMGYAFYVSQVAVYSSAQSNVQMVDVLVNITQIGVAPFYYDLSIVLECGINTMKSIGGVNKIIQKGQSESFIFRNIPGSRECLDGIKLGLQSSYAYGSRPIRFAQGSKGTLSFSVPLPPVPMPAPVVAPVPMTNPVPVKTPPAPVPFPLVVPTPVVSGTIPSPIPPPSTSPSEKPESVPRNPVSVVAPYNVPVPVTPPIKSLSWIEAFFQLVIARFQYFMRSIQGSIR